MTSKSVFRESWSQKLYLLVFCTNFDTDRNLTFFRNFWPLVTLIVLENNFLKTWRLQLFNFEGLLAYFGADRNLAFLTFLEFFDLCWPWLTSTVTFLKSLRQYLHFEVYIEYFCYRWKFDLFQPCSEIYELDWPWTCLNFF